MPSGAGRRNRWRSTGIEAFLEAQSPPPPRHRLVEPDRHGSTQLAGAARPAPPFRRPALQRRRAFARGKPHPDIYLHARRALGVAPARCLVIEDHPVGVAAGAAAGMTVIGLLRGGAIAARP